MGRERVASSSTQDFSTMQDFPASLLDGLDLSALERIRLSAGGIKPTNKFANYSARLSKAWKQVRWLNLDQSPPLDILDIGLGAGYFLFVCQRQGHRGIGLDRPGFPVWKRVHEWLGIQSVDHMVMPNTPLPALGRFDLVTSFMCPFNYLDSERRFWTLAEWSFFFDHLRNDVLKPGGRVAFELKGAQGQESQIHDPSFVRLCSERGGVLTKQHLVFDRLR
jgi:SAM-dependent methyltransferase